MAITSSLSVHEYLHSVYRPDRDYIDGELQERNVGEYDHAAVQGALIRWFGQRRQEWGIRVVPEQRVQVTPTRFRIPDVCVLSRSLPIEQIVTRPPIVCIEVLSPADTLQRMQERIADYRNFGVQNVWIVDPVSQQGYDCQARGMLRAVDFAVPETPLHLSLAALFADLD